MKDFNLKMVLFSLLFVIILSGKMDIAVAEIQASDDVSRVPLVPVVLDGQTYQPNEMKQFEGTTLHYVLTSDALKGGFIYAFSTKRQLNDFIQHYDVPSLPEFQQIPTPYAGPCAPGPGGCYYEYAIYGGCNFATASNISDLSNFTSCTGNWDGVISSMEVKDVAWGVLYEDSWWNGSSFWVHRYISISNLNNYGWNDRAWSIRTYN